MSEEGLPTPPKPTLKLTQTHKFEKSEITGDYKLTQTYKFDKFEIDRDHGRFGAR